VRLAQDITAAFGQTLLALKIYSTRYVHYRFSALIAFARTQPTCLLIIIVLYNKIYIVAPLNAQESADVADQYYRSATFWKFAEGRSRFEVRTEERRGCRGNESLERASVGIERVQKGTELITEYCETFLLLLVLN